MRVMASRVAEVPVWSHHAERKAMALRSSDFVRALVRDCARKSPWWYSIGVARPEAIAANRPAALSRPAS